MRRERKGVDFYLRGEMRKDLKDFFLPFILKI